MKIVTANDLKSGAVIWWTGVGWSLDVDESADVGEDGAKVIAREEGAQNAVSAYVIDAEKDDQGVRPAHIKERIRAFGPTVRLDLTVKPADPNAVNWVI